MTYDTDYLDNARQRIKLALDMRRTSEDALAIAQIATAEAIIAVAQQLRAANHLALLTGASVSAAEVAQLPENVRHALWPDEERVPDDPDELMRDGW